MKSFYLLLALLFISPVSALTASPAKFELSTPAGAAAYSITVHNDEDYETQISFTASGPFATSIVVPQPITLAAGERRTVPIQVSIPANVQPGTLEGGILIESRGASGGTVSASGAVFHLIELVTPQQGAYLSGELLASTASAGRATALTLVLRNTGTEDVAATAELSVDGEQLLTRQAVLAPGATQNVVVDWTPPDLGQYVVTSRVIYADKEFSLRRELVVGDLSAEIVDVDFGAFVLGSPFRVSVIVQNNWGQQLPLVASAVVVQDGVVAHAAEGIQVVADAGELVAIPVFLESGGLREGDAALRLQVSYANQQESLTIPIYLSENAISGEVPAAQETRGDVPWTYVFGLLAITTIIIFIKRRRSSTNKGG